LNAAGIVVYVVALGAAFTIVNGTGLFLYQLTNPGVPSAATTLAQNFSCGVSAAGLPYNCQNVGVGATPNIVSTIFTFGDFFWAFISAFPIMLGSIGVPGSIAALYFGSTIGAGTTAVFMLIFIMWIWGFIGARGGTQTAPE
jgi:hypothetical protein